jgi:hypothetical protein
MQSCHARSTLSGDFLTIDGGRLSDLPAQTRAFRLAVAEFVEIDELAPQNRALIEEMDMTNLKGSIKLGRVELGPTALSSCPALTIV